MNDLFDNRFIVNSPFDDASYYSGKAVSSQMAKKLLENLTDSAIADCTIGGVWCEHCPLSIHQWIPIGDGDRHSHCFMRRTPAYHAQLRHLCEQYES